MPHPTLVDMFFEQADAQPDRAALFCKAADVFHGTSWSRLATEVQRVAAGLVAWGVQPGDRVLQLSENRYEWVILDLAIQTACAVHVPVHSPLAAEQVAYQIEDSQPRVIVVSTAEQAEKVERCGDCLSVGQHVFSFDPCTAKTNGESVRAWQELSHNVGREAEEGARLQASQRLGPDSLATILYTSGTTGEPKGVMLTQQNLVSNTLATLAAIGHDQSDLRLNFLPLSHIFARTCDLYTWIAAGAQLALAESRDTVLADCATLKPTVLNAVPFFYDKVQRVLTEHGRADEQGVLQEVFGGRIRLCCSGGAALADHVFDFYQQRGLPILQGYGLSETSPVITVSTPTHARRGSAGRAVPGVEISIADDGEILTRGPHVMAGYYRNPAATDEMIRAGWLYTGDLGHLDDDGFLFITGRKKEILVTSGGKNVAPVFLESLLTEDPLILQALVVGDDRNYLAALIVPDLDALRGAISESEIQVPPVPQALEHPKIVSWYEERIRQRLQRVSYYEQVRKFTLLDRGFTIEKGELTPKMSLRRKIIEKNFRPQIEAMYEK